MQTGSNARAELLQRRLRGGGATEAASPIIPMPRDGALPLSFAQRGLWLLDQIRPGGVEYLTTLRLRLPADLDVSALKRALAAVVGRHEVLRTRYHAAGMEPVQVVDAPGPVALHEVDLSALDASGADRQLTELLVEAGRRPVDLATEWPIRALLVRLPGKDYSLVVYVHHIATDGGSEGVLLGELDACYSAFSSGGTPDLAPLPVQYADFAVWQRDQLSDGLLDQNLAYWGTKLAGLSPLELPTDRPRGPVRNSAGAIEPITVPATVAQALVGLAREHGATPYMALLAAFQMLLARYTGQADVVVGSPVAGREQPATQDLIGMFVNMIVLRTELPSELSFGQALGRVRETALAAYTHQDTPFDRLVEELAPERDPSRTPLFQVVFQLESGEPAGLPGLRAEREAAGGEVARFDLDLTLALRPDGSVVGQLEYATALFDAGSVRRLLDSYLRLLEGIVADPTRQLGELDLLSAEERSRLLGSATEFDIGQSLPAVFQCQVERNPDAIAVSCAGERLSYAELNTRANRLAHRLRALGAGPGTLVGISVERTAELVVAVLSVLKAGAGYVPLDPGQPAERLSLMREDAGIRVVVSGGEPAGWLADTAITAVALDERDGRDWPDTDPTPLAAPHDVAYVIYTSGSTGKPKGVPVTHANVLRLLRSSEADFGFGPSDVWSMFHSYAFDFSVWELWGALLYGGRVVVVPFEISRSPWDFLELLRAEGVTVLNQTPSAFRRLIEACEQADTAPGSLALRTVILGGEAVDTADMQPWFDRFGDSQPVVVNMYGITETTVHVTYRPLLAGDAGGGRRSPIGRPLPDLRAYLLDPDLNPVPVGVVGQLYVSGAGLARGYLNRPELTADRFEPDPFATVGGTRMYRTGDLARHTADGDLEFLGRADDQVKIRGHRIEPGEIEAALNGHPSVARSLVVAHRNKDEREYRLVAYLLPTPAAELDIAALREHLGRTLPAYMVPAIFVPVDRLAVTANGKVDRKALPDPDGQPAAAGASSRAPRNSLEQQVAEVWAGALGVPAVGVDDNFFAMGGDSIRAIQVVGALRGQGISLSVQALMLNQTVASLSRFVAAAEPAEDSADEHRVAPFELVSDADRARLPADLVDAYPMSMGQTAMVYEMVADPEVSLYHNITLFPIADDVPFSLPALRAAAELLVERHEILRTSFDLTSYREPLQLVHRAATVELGYDDVRQLAEAEAEAAMQQFVVSTRRTPMDVTVAPMARFHVHQTVDSSWTLSFIECHAILDGWSHHSLLNELLASYRRLRDGRQPEPPIERPVRYADYISLEKRSLNSPVDREFWRDRLERFIRIELPVSWAAAPDATGLPYRVSVPFADLEPDLRRLAAEAGASLKSVLFTAHLKALSIISGSRRFHSGLVHNGRLEAPGGELARGMHLNPLPVCLDLTGTTWTELVRQVFAEEVAVWPHRRFPLPEMQRAWGGSTTLVDVAFAYLDFHVFDSRRVEMAKIVDVSPNGFGLDVWTFPGVLYLAALPDRISQPNGLRLAGLYRRVLEAMAADPRGEARGTLLAEDEADLLSSFAAGERVQFPPSSVHELFEQQVRRNPAAVALRCADGQQLDYAEVNARANRLARRLRELGVGPESLVGVLLRRGPGLVTALLAVLKAGAAYLPLDPNHPAARLATVLEEAGAGAIVTESGLAERVTGFPATTLLLDEDASIAGQPDGDLGISVPPEALAYVIYTSGSTGTPKGVMIEHRNLVNYLSWRQQVDAAGPGSGAPLYSSMAFDLPVTSLFPSLLAGEAVTLAADDGTPGVDALVTVLERGGFRLVKLTPSHLAMLSQVLPATAMAGATGRLVVGGEELTRDMLTAWVQHAPATIIDNEYGPTEATVGCSIQQSTAGELAAGLMPIGRPVANTVLRVLDADLALTPVGVLGELYIGGSQLARGYLGRPALTAERFVPDPFSSQPGQRLYRSGDLVRYREDGVLEFAGRVDDQVKIRGYRVELGEVEALLRKHLDLQDVAVRVRQTARGDKELIGYLVPARGSELDPDTLAGRLAHTAPEYLIPSAWVVLDELPMTLSGKVDARALPEPAASNPSWTQLAPRTAVEKIIETVLAGALGRESIGVDVPFSDLGVHSLLIIRVLVELREEHGLPIELKHFYEHRTVMDLATAVDPAIQGGFPPTVAAEMASSSDWASEAILWLRRTGDKPPLFCMYPGGGLWYVRLAEQMAAERPVAALEWPGLHRAAPSPQSITSIAALFVDQIRKARPSGPYHLLGWCGGGLVTGEMARMLHRDGEQLTLVLLDPAQDAYTRGGMWEETGMFVRGEQLLADLDVARDPAEIAEIQRQFAEVLDYIIDEGTKEAPIPGDTFWPRRLRVWRELTQAMLGYRQRPYPGRMHLLVGDELAEGLHEANEGQTYAQYQERWVKLAPNGLKIHRVGGNHLGVLRPPHVGELARLLTSLMEATEQADS